ncbi:MAG: ABC transporter ATP-binding protein [Thermoguttaceae bacterium]|jgi:NitT/TauT family transport system ATP-binding protein|nr:ABC transporter ATP-binding protein [Thermoguttaceae bacterium]
MIRFENISMSFSRARAGRLDVLRGIDFQIQEGELVCLLGPSGCGKSTLLNLAAGFLVPDSGRVVFGGAPVSTPGPERGVIFQEPTLFPWLTVFGNVAFGLRAAGVNPGQVQAKVKETLRLAGIEGFDDQYPHALSGGMRQRVALARVLVLDPKALLMDEPFSSLDANSRERLQDELLRIWQAHRRTILFVTHSVQEAAYLADRIVLMGPPPAAVQSEIVVDLQGPRDRNSPKLRQLEDSLRSQLGALPCCHVPREADRSERCRSK